MLDYVPLRYRSLRLGRVLDKLYLSQYCSDKADLTPPNLLTKAPASLPGNGGAILPSQEQERGWGRGIPCSIGSFPTNPYLW